MMKNIFFCVIKAAIILCNAIFVSSSTVVKINELHHANVGDLVGGFIELVVDSDCSSCFGSSLLGFHDANGAYIDYVFGPVFVTSQLEGKTYATFELTSSYFESITGIAFWILGSDGVWRINDFISFGGTITFQWQTGYVSLGPVVSNGYVTSIDIGIIENSTTPVGWSLQRQVDNSWIAAPSTRGYKNMAPVSPTPSPISSCIPSFRVYNAGNDTGLETITENGSFTKPPCSINIEAVICTAIKPPVTIKLFRKSNGVITLTKFRHEKVSPFFLFGNKNKDVFSGKISAGSYTVESIVNNVTIATNNFNLGICV